MEESCLRECWCIIEGFPQQVGKWLSAVVLRTGCARHREPEGPRADTGECCSVQRHFTGFMISLAPVSAQCTSW